jgi:hypothetical protein
MSGPNPAITADGSCAPWSLGASALQPERPLLTVIRSKIACPLDGAPRSRTLEAQARVRQDSAHPLR